MFVDGSVASGRFACPTLRQRTTTLGCDFWLWISVDKTLDARCDTGKSKMAGDIDLGVSLGCFTCSKGGQINLACFYDAIFMSKILRQLW